jgi:Fic family protein
VILRYRLPRDWVAYDLLAILDELMAAKAAMLALTQMPYQRSWADKLQQIQLKREVAGTSRIEGAEFTERELEAAMHETPEQLETRSQKQAAAALATYRWIAKLPQDGPLDEALVLEIHRRLVTGCDDDHCPPGQMRKRDQNVTFGAPRHRGVEGCAECAKAMRALVQATRTVFTQHDSLIQALALHYHFAAMHPFLDGNGRTARALEALMLQRIGLRDTLFIAMSNYYYENKIGYLNALNAAGEPSAGLTPFLKFALRGIERQCRRLFDEIKLQVTKALYRNTVTDLFGRLKSPRKRVMSNRHVQLLNLLLDEGEINVSALERKAAHFYVAKHRGRALIRDLAYLRELEAIAIKEMPEVGEARISIRLEWPEQITETEFFRRARSMPKAKVHGFLST